MTCTYEQNVMANLLIWLNDEIKKEAILNPVATPRASALIEVKSKIQEFGGKYLATYTTGDQSRVVFNPDGTMSYLE